MIYLSLFHWKDHPVSSQTSKSAVGEFRLCYTLRISLFYFPLPLTPAAWNQSKPMLALSLTLQPVGVSAGTSPVPFNQELQEQPRNQKWEKCCFHNRRNSRVPNITAYLSRFIFFFSEKLDTQAYISKKTVYKFSLSYVHTEGQRNCNLYNRTLVHPMIF